jgi:hypothetical protein
MFDTLTYANKLKEAGFTERQAQAQAEALVAVVDSNLATKTDIEMLRRATKTDIEMLRHDTKADIEMLRHDTKADIEMLHHALSADIEMLRHDTKTDIEMLRHDLRADIAETKAEIIKWCVGSVFASVGLFAALVKLMD